MKLIVETDMQNSPMKT